MKKLMMFDSELGYRMGLRGANQEEKINFWGMGAKEWQRRVRAALGGFQTWYRGRGEHAGFA